jgi:hypothetical protein
MCHTCPGRQWWFALGMALQPLSPAYQGRFGARKAMLSSKTPSFEVESHAGSATWLGPTGGGDPTPTPSPPPRAGA